MNSLLHQHSVPQIAPGPQNVPRTQTAMPQSRPVQPMHIPPRMVMPLIRQAAGQPVMYPAGQPIRPFLPRKDVVQVRAGSQSHTPVKSWVYGRVPSPCPEGAFAAPQPVPSYRRSSCALRPEILSARREAPSAGKIQGDPCGVIHPVMKSEEGMLYVPDVRPMVQSATDATLLSVWPGLDEARDPAPQKERGQLTPEEKLDYRELKFVEHLGSGEFGQVFRGSYKGQEVAIKQLYWDNTVLPQVIIQDLTREIESFRHLRHKRLVNFVGACLEIPNLCIVTEYAPGGSLHHLLHVRKLQLPLLHCTNMCLQLAEGVVYLHSQNPIVVHRDLKSLNVVLDLSLNLKLCDFGLTESMERTHITKKNNGGSPRYMAPELFDSKSKITEKVDIWSMGCIFTEINGGPLPYEGINTLAELTREMLVNRRTPSIPPHVAEPLQVVIAACYSFDARFRPSARQVYDQLREAKKTLQSQGLLS